MMILYVPFPRSHAGDLISRVEIWKKEQSKITNEPIDIFYHGDDFDFDAIPDLPSEIYICAHGFSDSLPLIVGNNADLEKTDYIDIKTVTDRFNKDFGPAFHQISAIHLYCCGSKNKNQKMAEEFRIDLLRQDISIHSYAGSITAPDSNGVRWSFRSTQQVPVQSTESVLFRQTFEIPEHRRDFKPAMIQRTYEQSRAKRRDQFFAEGKAARHAEIHRRRQAESMDAASTTIPQSEDDISATSTPTPMG